MFLGPLYILFNEVSVQALCLFFNWIVCLTGLESCEFFIYFGDQTLVRDIIGKYIFPYSWFPFHLLMFPLAVQKLFYFDEVPFVYSFLYVPCSKGHIGENIAVWNIWDFPAYVLLWTFMLSWLIFMSLSILSIFLCMV